jgi:hypothetical protein
MHQHGVRFLIRSYQHRLPVAFCTHKNSTPTVLETGSDKGSDSDDPGGRFRGTKRVIVRGKKSLNLSLPQCASRTR